MHPGDRMYTAREQVQNMQLQSLSAARATVRGFKTTADSSSQTARGINRNELTRPSFYALGNRLYLKSADARTFDVGEKL